MERSQLRDSQSMCARFFFGSSLGVGLAMVLLALPAGAQTVRPHEQFAIQPPGRAALTATNPPSLTLSEDALSISDLMAMDAAKVAALDAGQRKAVLETVEGRLRQTVEFADRLRTDIYTVRAAERRDNAEVKQLQVEIDALKVKIEQVLDDAPEVATLREQLERAQEQLSELGRLRIKLLQVPQATPPGDAAEAVSGEAQP